MVQNIQKAHLEMLLLKEFKAYIHHLLPHLDDLRNSTDNFSYTIDFVAGGMFQLLMAWSKRVWKIRMKKWADLVKVFDKPFLVRPKT